MRKLNTNKTQMLHRIHLRKCNAEKHPGDNYQEAHWQIDDNINVSHDDLYTLAWEPEFGGHLFHISIINTDPNAIDFDENYILGPDTVIVLGSYFHDSRDGRNWETCPTSDPSVVHSSNPKSLGQSQNVQITTDLDHNDSSTKTSESSTDNETAFEPVQQPPLRQSDNPSTLHQHSYYRNSSARRTCHSRSVKYNLRPNPTPIYSERYRY